MQTTITNLTTVTDKLESYGYKIPKTVQPLLDSADAIRYAYDGAPVPPTDLVTEGEEAERVLYAYANEVAVYRQTSNGSALNQAKRELIESYQNLALAELRKDSERIFEKLSGVVDTAAEKLNAVIDMLPEKITNETLVNSGASAIEALATAKEAGSILFDVSLFVFNYGPHIGINQHRDTELRMFAPRTEAELHGLEAVKSAAGTIENQIGGKYLYAARNGIKIQLNDTVMAQNILVSIEANRVATEGEKRPAFKNGWYVG